MIKTLLTMMLIAALSTLTSSCLPADFSGENSDRRGDDEDLGLDGPGIRSKTDKGSFDAGDGDGGDPDNPVGSSGKPDGGDADDDDDDDDDNDGDDGDGDGNDDGDGNLDGNDDGDDDGKIDGQDDVIGSDDGASIIQDTVDSRDGGSGEIDDDEIRGKKSILTIKGVRRDRNGGDDTVEIIITNPKGKVLDARWPNKGETIEVEGVCRRSGESEIEIEVRLRGRTFRPSQRQCFIGKRDGDEALHMGFEHDCDSTDYDRIDDAIAHFSCPNSDLEIEDLTMNNGIPLNKWID